MATMREIELPYLRSKRQAARFLNVSPGSIERLMRSGLEYVKVGGLVRFTPESLADYLERNRRGRKVEAAPTPDGDGDLPTAA
jgi:excisionase family DNA binding protein